MSYTLEHNAKIARGVLDHVSPSPEQLGGQRLRRVLMGHSLGAVSAALAAIERPEVPPLCTMQCAGL